MAQETQICKTYDGREKDQILKVICRDYSNHRSIRSYRFTWNVDVSLKGGGFNKGERRKGVEIGSFEMRKDLNVD